MTDTTRATMAPTVHKNGTGSEALLTQCCAAAHAIEDALQAARAAAPNGRDYYVQGPKAFEAACAEHRDRVARLVSVQAEYESLSERIAEQ